MPNCWRRLNRLPPAEEKSFIERNTSLLERIDNAWKKNFSSYGTSTQSNWLLRLNSIYVEQAGEDTFFRLIYVKDELPDFYDKSVFFIQALLFNVSGEARLLMTCAYNKYAASERGNRHEITSIDLVSGNNGVKGVLFTRFGILVESVPMRKVKGQIVGINNSGYYYFLNDIKDEKLDLEPIPSWDFIPSIVKIPYIFIQASDCLVDENIPLRYSLQNAFDGDPSTSYVENTPDDLMEIDFAAFKNGLGWRGIVKKKIERVAIINGYAQSVDLYKKNNRIREFLVSGRQWNDLGVMEETIPDKLICKDNTLGYQFYLTDSQPVPSTISIISSFRGSVYNDTCLAELNIKTKEGWLFGEINE